MKKFISFVLVCLLAVSFATAHRGRTDAQGGHYDTNNESGLGSYHYHHGYSAHLHENGVCPYEAPTTPEPTQTEPTQTAPEQRQPEQQPLLEPVSEEDIDYSQFESLEDAYESGYFYALYYGYSSLYEVNEYRTELQSLINLGVATKLYFQNSEITYAQPTSEGFTNEDAFIEGESQGLADLENTLSEYKNSDFYTNNEIYKAGYDAATEEIATSEQVTYQNGYKKGVIDTQEEYQTEKNTSNTLKIIILLLNIIAIAFIIYILQQLFFRLDEKYQSTITRALMWIFTVLMIITIIPYIIACILFRFYNWQMERNKRYAEEEKQLLLKHYEMYKKGEYLPQIWELEEFRKNGWSN